ncbi:MAG TPA: hypothetical protein IAB55_02085 [Candidatus Merdivicinus faecavium]|nr:hypothetical protein [Candidatus Merdivicinus faecavium]
MEAGAGRQSPFWGRRSRAPALCVPVRRTLCRDHRREEVRRGGEEDLRGRLFS